MAMPKCKVIKEEYNEVDTTAYMIECDNTHNKYYGVLIDDNFGYSKEPNYQYSAFRLTGNTTRAAWQDLINYWNGGMYLLKPMPKGISEASPKTALIALQHHFRRMKRKHIDI
jgi:hypothetical protein